MQKSRGSSATLLQMNKLLDILSEETVLEKGVIAFPSSKQRHLFWRRVATRLNAIPGGSSKTPWQWNKVWIDWKYKIKKKVTQLVEHHEKQDLQHVLSPLEWRSVNLTEFSVGKAGLQTPLKSEPLDTDDPIKADNDAFMAEEGQSDAEDRHQDASQFLTQESGSDALADNTQDDEKCFDMMITETYQIPTSSKVTMKRKRQPRVKSNEMNKSNEMLDSDSLESFKIKASMSLEREKLRQSNEELRLKAIELKLREDELKIKQSEMEKVIHLTNVEEDKLKCFKEMTSLLKELVERTRNGNPCRFPNM